MLEMFIALTALMLAMLLYEHFRPGRKFPAVRGWLLRSFAMIAVQIFVVELGGLVWDHWFARINFLKFADWGMSIGTLAAFTVISFISYWQHRLKHRINFLWRYLHQIHHAPTRIELLTSFYRNPIEIFLNMLLMSFILYSLLGCNATIARNVVFLMGVADLFYHWNIRTPFWLGYIIQRPEAHCVHHLSGVHAYNYGDIPLWDILFGTYRNPRHFQGSCGFVGDAEFRFFSMMLGNDLSNKRLRQ